MSARRTTNAELNAASQGLRRQSDTVMTQILQEHRADQKAKKRGRPRTRPEGAPTGGGLDPGMLLDLDLGNEVGQMTPPLRIYRPDHATGELRLVGTVSAVAFRNQALTGPAGEILERRRRELLKKRQKAGQRAKDRARIARSRYASIGRKLVAPCTVEEPTTEALEG